MRKLVGILLLVGFAMLANAQSYGAWTAEKKIDLITDENSSIMVAQATDYPSLARYSALAVRCTSSPLETYGVEVFFAADKYLGIEDYYSVVFRVDKGEPVYMRWSASTNHEAAFLPTNETPRFLSAIKSGSELIFRISGYSQDYTYVVPVRGFNDALFALGCYKGPPL